MNTQSINVLKHIIYLMCNTLADLEGGLRGLLPPFQISKIEESYKTKQKIEDNPLEKEEERKSCIFV